MRCCAVLLCAALCSTASHLQSSQLPKAIRRCFSWRNFLAMLHAGVTGGNKDQHRPSYGVHRLAAAKPCVLTLAAATCSGLDCVTLLYDSPCHHLLRKMDQEYDCHFNRGSKLEAWVGQDLGALPVIQRLCNHTQTQLITQLVETPHGKMYYAMLNGALHAERICSGRPNSHAALCARRMLCHSMKQNTETSTR